jgi:hypothetical protein
VVLLGGMWVMGVTHSGLYSASFESFQFSLSVLLTKLTRLLWCTRGSMSEEA